LVLALALPLTAAPVPEKSRTPGPAELIRRELDDPVTLELSNQSLDDAVNQLRDRTKLNLVLDRVTLAQSGIDPAQAPVNDVKLRDVKARAALRTVLTPYNLHFVIVGDTLLVTTEEMAAYRQLKQRVSLDLNGVEFATALKGLARDTGVNLVLDPRVAKEGQTRVSLQVDDIPLESAVRMLGEMAGLKPVRLGNSLFLTARATAADLRAEPDLAPAPTPRVVDPDAPGVAKPPAVLPPPPPAPAAPGALPLPAVPKQ
jgi:hypothetical protein